MSAATVERGYINAVAVFRRPLHVKSVEARCPPIGVVCLLGEGRMPSQALSLSFDPRSKLRDPSSISLLLLYIMTQSSASGPTSQKRVWTSWVRLEGKLDIDVLPTIKCQETIGKGIQLRHQL
ncbi:hypothetical protein TNCV_4910991 [Trichonephila clavipes]|nr:hypothetical protein TNCV_4910991 [Trichonephila clavipes]